MNVPALKRFGPVVCLFAWSAWLASAYLLSGPSSYIRQHDTAEVNTPYYTALPRLAAKGLIGFRDPLAGTGVDALANLKGDMPLVEVFFRIAPSWASSGILLLSQTFVAALGLFLLLRRRFDASVVPATVAAAWFAFLPSLNVAYSGFPTWYGWYVPGLPFVLLVLTGRDRPVAHHLALATFSGAMFALGTPAASGILVLVIVAAWLASFRNGQTWRRTILVMACFAAAFLVVKTPTLIALFTGASESHRLVRTGLPFGAENARDLWRNRVADFRDVAGAQFLLLTVAAAGWIAGGFHRRPMNVLAIGITTILALTLLTPLLQQFQGGVGAVFRTYQTDRINRFLPLLAAAAAGLALDHLRRTAQLVPARSLRRAAWRGAYATGAGVLAVTVVWLSISMNMQRERSRLAGNRYDAFFEQPALVALGRELATDNLFRVATFADRNSNQYGQHAAFAWAYGLETADVYGTMYPLRFHAFWTRVIEPTLQRRPDIRDYYGRWGNMAYLFNPAATLFDILPPDNDPSLTPVPFNLPLLSLANVRYVVSRVPLEDPQLRLREGTGDLKVYENTGGLPRFFVVYDWRGFSTEQDLLDAMARTDSGTLRSAAMLEEANARSLGAPPAPLFAVDSQDVNVRRYEADVIELEVDAAARGLLIASNSYSPYWVSTVDGAPAAVLPAYHAFQAVPVPGGRHHVVLTYTPPHSFGGNAQSLIVTTIVSGIGLLAIGLGRYAEA